MKKFLKFLLINSLRLLFLLMFLCCAGLEAVSSIIKEAAHGVCTDLGVFRGRDSDDAHWEAKFSEEEIEAMALKTSDQMTIHEIQEKFGVSYRQARKIKHASPIAVYQGGQMA